MYSPAYETNAFLIFYIIPFYSNFFNQSGKTNAFHGKIGILRHFANAKNKIPVWKQTGISEVVSIRKCGHFFGQLNRCALIYKYGICFCSCKRTVLADSNVLICDDEVHLSLCTYCRILHKYAVLDLCALFNLHASQKINNLNLNHPI